MVGRIKTISAIIVSGIIFLMVQGARAEELRFASEGAYPPFNYVDSNNTLIGFDIDIAYALCEKMKVKCVIVAQDWDGSIPGLLARKYDAVINSMAPTPEREKAVDFTDRYYTSELAIAVRKDSAVHDMKLSSLKGMRLGAQAGTAMAAYAEDVLAPAGVSLWFYPTAEDANSDMLIGRIDGLIHEKFPLLDWLRKQGSACCRLLGYAENTQQPIAIAVRKDAGELKQRLNRALQEIRADGTYLKISKKYFDTDIY